jgi:hypothetical protein
MSTAIVVDDGQLDGGQRQTEKATMKPALTPSHPRIDLKSFSPLSRVGKKLAQMDKDGDGSLDVQELESAVESLLNATRDRRLLIVMLTGTFVVVCLLISVIAGCTYSIVQAAKDTQMSSNGVMLDKATGNPVGVSTGYISPDFSCTTLLRMPDDELMAVRELMVPGPNGGFRLELPAIFFASTPTSNITSSRVVILTTLLGTLVCDSRAPDEFQVIEASSDASIIASLPLRPVLLGNGLANMMEAIGVLAPTPATGRRRLHGLFTMNFFSLQVFQGALNRRY